MNINNFSRDSGKKVKSGDLILNVTDNGKGKPVLLVHGFPDSSAVWRNQIPALTGAGYRVIAPDNRGFGLSGMPAGTGNYKIRLIADDLLAILDYFNIRKTALVAHDWGVPPSWQFVNDHPDRVSCFTTISMGNPAAYLRYGRLSQLLCGWYTLSLQFPGLSELFLKSFHWHVFRMIVQDHPETERWIFDLSRENALTSGISWYRANIFRVAFGNTLKSAVPTLGIWSDRDIYLTEKQMISSGRYVNNDWHYQKIRNATHWIMLDRPDELNAGLLNFFSRYWPA